jgi:hypothetical protein
MASQSPSRFIAYERPRAKFLRFGLAPFAAVAFLGGVVTLLFSLETKGRVLEDLSR